MKFRIEHVYDTTPERFWREVFFDADYNRDIYLKALGFRSFEVLEQSGDLEHGLTRRVLVVPELPLPKALEKLFKAKPYEEVGRFDPQSQRWKTHMKLPALGDKIDIRSEMYVLPEGADRARRVVESDVEARVFGLGKVIEGFVERSMRDSYGRAAEFTNRWLKAHR